MQHTFCYDECYSSVRQLLTKNIPKMSTKKLRLKESETHWQTRKVHTDRIADGFDMSIVHIIQIVTII